MTIGIRSFGRAFILAVFLPLAVPSRAADVYLLRKVVIADSDSAAAALPADDGGDRRVVVHGVDFLNSADFDSLIAKYLGKPIDTATISALVTDIANYARSHDRILAKVDIPNGQNISSGTLRLAVLVGRYNQLIFRGNHWFSQDFLQRKLGLEPGDEIRLSVLDQALSWANANPFRDLKVFINDLPNEPGRADLIVNVVDARPIRFVASYSNSGVPILGRNQYSAGVQLGDLWKLDHQLSYQYVRSDNPRLFSAHLFDYTAPLPWRHYVEVSASYSLVHPTFNQGLLGQTGENTTVDLRYRIPFGTGNRTGEVFGGVQFKESNNNLQYGGLQLSSAKNDIFQAVLGLSRVLRDQKGAWAFTATSFLSPGNINSRNTDEQFQPNFSGSTPHVGRFGARARYAILDGSIQRWQRLDKGWDFFSRLTGQLATSNLISDEQLTIGGSGTIRGFNPNVMSGEQGYVLNNDLQTPKRDVTLGFLPKTAHTLTVRGNLFYDIGEVFYKTHFPTVDRTGRQVGWDDDPLRPLAGAGVGLRANIGSYFNLSLDYGWAVTHPKPPIDTHGMGHIKVVLAF